MPNATTLFFEGAILVMSVIIHEVSHGVVAYLLGDRTAQYQGRLTLNPIPHIDPFGSILLPLLLIITGSPIVIGWARPVPYNPYNLKSQKWGPALVGAAGPLSNLTIAALFGIGLRFFGAHTNTAFLTIATYIVFINIVLAVFNLVPIPPLDGSKVLFALLPYRFWKFQQFLEAWGFVLLLIFIFLFSSFVGSVADIIFKLITGS